MLLFSHIACTLHNPATNRIQIATSQQLGIIATTTTTTTTIHYSLFTIHYVIENENRFFPDSPSIPNGGRWKSSCSPSILRKCSVCGGSRCFFVCCSKPSSSNGLDLDLDLDLDTAASATITTTAAGTTTRILRHPRRFCPASQTSPRTRRGRGRQDDRGPRHVESDHAVHEGKPVHAHVRL